MHYRGRVDIWGCGHISKKVRLFHILYAERQSILLVSLILFKTDIVEYLFILSKVHCLLILEILLLLPLPDHPD